MDDKRQTRRSSDRCHSLLCPLFSFPLSLFLIVAPLQLFLSPPFLSPLSLSLCSLSHNVYSLTHTLTVSSPLPLSPSPFSISLSTRSPWLRMPLQLALCFRYSAAVHAIPRRARYLVLQALERDKVKRLERGASRL